MSGSQQQIGWNVEAKLLQKITKQLDQLIKLQGVVKTTTTTTTATP